MTVCEMRSNTLFLFACVRLQRLWALHVYTCSRGPNSSHAPVRDPSKIALRRYRPTAYPRQGRDHFGSAAVRQHFTKYVDHLVNVSSLSNESRSDDGGVSRRLDVQSSV